MDFQSTDGPRMCWTAARVVSRCQLPLRSATLLSCRHPRWRAAAFQCAWVLQASLISTYDFRRNGFVWLAHRATRMLIASRALQGYEISNLAVIPRCFLGAVLSAHREQTYSSSRAVHTEPVTNDRDMWDWRNPDRSRPGVVGARCTAISLNS